MVSPDGKWLAYRIGSPATLVVASSSGQRVAQISWKSDWRQLAGWVNDHSVLISRKRALADGSVLDPHDALVLFDPFTSQLIELPADLPDFLELGGGPGWGLFGYSGLIFGPALDRVGLSSGRYAIHALGCHCKYRGDDS